MCNFFSCIVHRSGRVYFTEDNLHEIVIERCEAEDNLESFVRVEYTRKGGYIIDEISIPEWYERIAAKAKREVKARYKKVVAAHKAMIKVRIKAYQEYDAAIEDSRGAVWYENRLRCAAKKREAIQCYIDKIKHVKGYVGPLL